MTFFLLWFFSNSSTFTQIQQEEWPSLLCLQFRGMAPLDLLSLPSAVSWRLKMVGVGRLFSTLFPSSHSPLLVTGASSAVHSSVGGVSIREKQTHCTKNPIWFWLEFSPCNITPILGPQNVCTRKNMPQTAFRGYTIIPM